MPQVPSGAIMLKANPELYLFLAQPFLVVLITLYSFIHTRRTA